MNRRFAGATIVLTAALLLGRSSAQQSKAITPEVLKGLEQSCLKDAQFKAVHNAIAQADARRLALDWEAN